MEEYTLETTMIDLENGKINNEEFELITNFIKARDRYHYEDDNMERHFREKFKHAIDNAKSKEDFEPIREGLRLMPQCPGKTLIFRTIIMNEDKL